MSEPTLSMQWSEPGPANRSFSALPEREQSSLAWEVQEAYPEAH